MKKSVVIIVSIVAVLVIGGGIGAKLYFDNQKEQEARAYEEKVAFSAQEATSLVTRISGVLTSNAPITWVYDRDENLIMTLRAGSDVQSVTTLPTVLSEAIKEACAGDPASLIMKEYFIENDIVSVDYVIDGYLRRLSQEFSEDDLLKYLATTSTYGEGHVGIATAAVDYFGKELGRLNEEQLAFLVAAYRHNDFDVKGYLESTGLTAERLELINYDVNYTSFKSLILEELQSIPNVDISKETYSIKLALAMSQQTAIQSVVDGGFRQLIALNNDGTYTYDCSAILVDRNSGLIRVYIPSRTSKSSNSVMTKVTAGNFRENLAALLEELKEPKFGFSLITGTRPNGDSTLRSLSELFFAGELAPSASNTQSITAYGLLDAFFAGNQSYKGISIIYQIQNSSGQTVYSADKDRKSVLSLDNAAICEFFNDSGEERTSYGFIYNLTSGVLSLKVTRDYVIAIIGGSSALGANVTAEQRQTMIEGIDKIRSTVATYYPSVLSMLWEDTYYTEFAMNAYTANYGLVGARVKSLINDLRGISINSQESRKRFEDIYSKANQLITDYTEYIGTGYAQELRDELQEVRLGVADLLLKYSV